MAGEGVTGIKVGVDGAGFTYAFVDADRPREAEKPPKAKKSAKDDVPAAE
jgi:hypothetical protein